MDFTSWTREQLETTLKELTIDKSFNCYTRQALPLLWDSIKGGVKWAVFFDLNKMHELNEQLGYTEVDRRIRQSLETRADDVTVARWYSGDEFVVFGHSGDYEGFIERLSKRFEIVGLSAMYAGTSELSGHYEQIVEGLTKEVQAQKAVRDNR